MLVCGLILGTVLNLIFTTLVTIIVAAGILLVSFVVRQVVSHNTRSSHRKFTTVNVCVVLCPFLSALQLLVVKVPEKEEFKAQAKEAMPMIPGVRSCMKNHPWVVLMLSGTTLSLVNEIVSMFQYLVQYQFHVRGAHAVMACWVSPPHVTPRLVQMKVKNGMAILMSACRLPSRAVCAIFD